MLQAHLKIVQQTHSQLQKDSHRFMTGCYANLFALAPHLRKSFPLDLRALQQELNISIRSMIANIDDEQCIRRELAAVARRHSAFGMHACHALLAQDAVLRTVNQQLGADFTWEVRDAWTTVLSRVVDIASRLDLAGAADTEPQAAPHPAQADPERKIDRISRAA